MQLVHYSRKPVTAVYSVPQQERPDFKPSGFWFSVDSCENNWKDWCESERFALECLECVHDVVLREDAKILRLRNATDIDEFSERFFEAGLSSLHSISWQRVAMEYQGIIIAPYVWSRRLTHPGKAGWYYPWDCASGVVWDGAVAQITLRGAPIEPAQRPDRGAVRQAPGQACG